MKEKMKSAILEVPSILDSLKSRQVIRDIIANMKSFDEIEQEEIYNTLAWIQSGAPIFRIKSPDIPNKHLVSYFVVLDEKNKKILLVDHKKAQLWLPTGGHIEMNEHPKDAVIRECFEELKMQTHFWSEDPIFLTSAQSVRENRTHTDICIWYVIKGDDTKINWFDPNEFNRIDWFSFNEIPYEQSDPHLCRFLNKLKTFL